MDGKSKINFFPLTWGDITSKYAFHDCCILQILHECELRFGSNLLKEVNKGLQNLAKPSVAKARGKKKWAMGDLLFQSIDTAVEELSRTGNLKHLLK
jgi:hypothetical protein